MQALKNSLGHTIRITILLCLSLNVSLASGFTVGEPFPNFTLPSAYSGYGKQLSEQYGKPVMLVVLDRCNRCEKNLIEFQHLNITHAINDLETWIVWKTYKKDQPPQISLPVLQGDSRLRTGWETPTKLPAIYLINRDGVLDHVLHGSLRSLRKQVKPVLEQWMKQE